jgi:hypothetical protein
VHGLDILDAFLLGLVGGLVPEFVTAYRLRKEPQMPQWFKRWNYWVPTFLMILAGGGLAALYTDSGTKLGPILAVNIGATAPLILGTISATAPTLSPGRIG